MPEIQPGLLRIVMRMASPHLAVVIPDRITGTVNGEPELDAKTISGLGYLADRWVERGGEVTVIGQAPQGVIEAQELHLANHRMRIIATPDRVATLREIQPTVRMILGMPSQLELMENSLPGILVPWVEFDMKNRLTYQFAQRQGLIFSLRARLGALRQEWKLRRQYARSGGLQINGFVAARAYAKTGRDLVYVDSRVYRDELAAEGKRTHPVEPLHFAFSGRAIPQKGFGDAVESFVKARDHGLNGVLHIFARKELVEGRVPEREDIVFHGCMDFHGEWMPYVRENIDALLFPHRQGDPACTYFEGVGLGVPFISYSNDTARILAEELDLGWVAPMDDVDALANLLLRLDQDRSEIARVSTNGVGFMQDHYFEHEMDRRVDHLWTIATAS